MADGIDDKDFADNSYFHLVAASEIIAVPSACFVLERAVFGRGPTEEQDVAIMEKLVALENLDAAHNNNSIVVELGTHFVDLPNSIGLELLKDVLEWQKRWNIEDDQKQMRCSLLGSDAVTDISQSS